MSALPTGTVTFLFSDIAGSTRLLHLKLAAVPPPIAPARSRQETFDWVA